MRSFAFRLRLPRWLIGVFVCLRSPRLAAVVRSGAEYMPEAARDQRTRIAVLTSASALRIVSVGSGVLWFLAHASVSLACVRRGILSVARAQDRIERLSKMASSMVSNVPALLACAVWPWLRARSGYIIAAISTTVGCVRACARDFGMSAIGVVRPFLLTASSSRLVQSARDGNFINV